jgi:hypothetical protein
MSELNLLGTTVFAILARQNYRTIRDMAFDGDQPSRTEPD